MIIRYDTKRGEPRGKRARSSDVHLPVISQPLGDCVDCSMCVTTCPTGIDIRKGLQMECVGCAQCIDACDAVMDKLERPRGLIRYSSENAANGGPTRILRPRVVVYPAIILIVAAAFTYVLLNTGIADVTLTRGLGQPFTMTEGGEVSNPARIKIVNRTSAAAMFTISVSGASDTRLVMESTAVTLEPGEMRSISAQIIAPPGAFTLGQAARTITVTGPEQFSRTLHFSLLGPRSPASTKHGSKS